MRSTAIPSGDVATFTATMDETKRIEWPDGSGVYAVYGPAERTIIREFYAARDAEQISDAEMKRDIGLIHEMKAVLDARLVVGDEPPSFSEPEQTVLYIPEPGSPFPIPARALEQLGISA